MLAVVPWVWVRLRNHYGLAKAANGNENGVVSCHGRVRPRPRSPSAGSGQALARRLGTTWWLAGRCSNSKPVLEKQGS